MSLSRGMSRRGMHSRRNRQRDLLRSGVVSPGTSMRAVQAMLRQRTTMTVAGHRRRPVRCGCGWQGKVSDLRNLYSEPGEAGMPASACGPSFPKCPECITDSRLT